MARTECRAVFRRFAQDRIREYNAAQAQARGEPLEGLRRRWYASQHTQKRFVRAGPLGEHSLLET